MSNPIKTKPEVMTEVDFLAEMKRRKCMASSYEQWKKNARNILLNKHSMTLGHIASSEQVFQGFWAKQSPIDFIENLLRHSPPRPNRKPRKNRTSQ